MVPVGGVYWYRGGMWRLGWRIIETMEGWCWLGLENGVGVELEENVG